MRSPSVTSYDHSYKQRRIRNNVSVQKSREKARREQMEMIISIRNLENERKDLLSKLQTKKAEYKILQQYFKEHTGLDLNDMFDMVDKRIQSQTKVSIESDTNKAKSVAKPTLTITTDENLVPDTDEIDAKNLDGAFVLINGIQYKIVGVN